MNIRKIICLCLALLCCFAGAFAEEDLQAQLDAANAKIAELQAQVDKYAPYYHAQIVATYGEDGVIWLKDMQAEYDAAASQYAGYGLDVEGMGLADMLKQSIVEGAVQDAIIAAKAEEMGLTELSEEELAALEADAQKTMDVYVEYYLSNYYPDTEATDEMRAEAEAYWDSVGVNFDLALENLKQTAAQDALYAEVTKDVAITEEDVQALYESMVADSKALYADDPGAFTSDYTGGSAAYVPEGYRAVKQVLVGFDDDQSAQYKTLQSTLTSLNDELAALETAEEGAELRTAEEINADIASCATQIEALYSQLTPTVEEVVKAFNDGASIDELIEKYNSDPGMTSEPYATMGYAVSADSDSYDPAFQQAAMSIAEIGQISEPAYGSYGAYIVYYLKDVAPGEVALEDIRSAVEEKALSTKLTTTYNDQLAAWTEAANVQYFLENFA